jgi:S1-C subfamily serine protease
MRLAFVALLFAWLMVGEPRVTPTQKTPADLVDLVRPEVVQVAVKIRLTPFNRRGTIPAPLAPCFQGSICVVGTGFFVNAVGDVVTASHVVNGIQGRALLEPGSQQIIQMLEVNGIHADTVIVVSIPNVENGHLTVASAGEVFPATFVAADAEHDIAVFHATVNPFTNMSKTFGGPGAVGLRQATAKVVHLAQKRPRDGEDIFACGFPFGEPELVTTSGTIASARKTETLLNAAATGLSRSVEVYLADLKINPGNSGGPVFRRDDQALLGMAVESKGSLGVVVPAKYIAEFLKAHGIQWMTAADIAPAVTKAPQRTAR